MKIRTGYSFRKAVGHIADVQDRLVEIGWNVAPISDRCSTFAFVNWTAEAKKRNLRPVYGVELAVVPGHGHKKPITDHWAFFATDSLRPLHELIAFATTRPGREPSLTYKEALGFEGLIKISGSWTQLDCVRDFAPEDFYMALGPSTPIGLYREAKRQGHRFIATSDNSYPRKADLEFYRVTLGKAAGTQVYPQHVLSDAEWLKAIGHIATAPEAEQALAHRCKALEQCSATLKKATLLKPQKDKSLRELCLEGAKRLGLELNDEYAARLERELAMIAEKDFEDYFYIIADMIAFAKEHMVVGPARGSSCGSLVCYLLGITTIDPIPFNLLFERFIDINRQDLPDIDIDFSDERRHLVFEYVEKKYGADRVARLGTVGVYRPRSILNRAAMSLNIPKWMTNKVADNIIDRSSGDSRALQAFEDTLSDTEAGRDLLKEYPEVSIANKMEGHPNNPSQHAAGIVITEDTIIDYVAIDSRTNSTMCDKYDAEKLNMLKIDALGLTQLSIFERCLELVGLPQRTQTLQDIPVDDAAAFDVLNRQQFAGIFQFNGVALQSLAKAIKTDCLEDIISMTALARPGPMASGGSNNWVKRRTGKSPVEYPHPLFEPALRSTLGVVAYQEQVMQIGRDIGDLSWEDVTALRKAMSKSLGKEYFDQFGERWKANASKKGIPDATLVRIWDDLCAYGSWAFNRSHAVAYGMVSYWCCYLKAHHPIEFAAATLDAEKDPLKQVRLLRELDREGIKYVAVDKDHSIDRWNIARDGDTARLVGPLTMVNGVGPKTLIEFMDYRRRGEELPARLQKKLKNMHTKIDSIYPVKDHLATLDLKKDYNIHSAPVPIRDLQPGITPPNTEVMIIGVVTKITPRDQNEEIKIAKRNGRRHQGPSAYLNLTVMDDTDEILNQIKTWKFEQWGKPVIERGKAGKAVYAIKGVVPANFRMLDVTMIRYLGDLNEGIKIERPSHGSKQGSDISHPNPAHDKLVEGTKRWSDR